MKTKKIKSTVATLIADKRFLNGTHCIEYRKNNSSARTYRDKLGDLLLANDSVQLACCRRRQDPKAPPFVVERQRNMHALDTDPWPRWRTCFGTCFDPQGIARSSSLCLSALLAPARLVKLASDDQVPPEEPVWENGRFKPDRFVKERRSYVAQ